MAKIIFSGLVDSMAGKLNGSVIQATKGGVMLRARVVPRNPSSGFQQQRRANQSVLYFAWRNLSSTDRDTWLGDHTPYPSGIDLFIAANQRLWSSGNAALSVWSGDGSQGLVPFVKVALTPDAFTITSTEPVGTLPTDIYAVIFCSPPQSPGISFISPNNHRLLTVYGPGIDINDTLDIYSLYVARFRAPIEGEQIGIAAYLLNAAAGNYDLTAYSVNRVLTM